MPWRATPDRIPAHDRCLKFWTEHGFTVVEADSGTGAFNRAKARNRAVAKAGADMLVLADADTLPAHITQITTAITLADKTNGAVWPYLVYRLLPADAVTIEDLSTVTAVRDFPQKWRPGGLTIITHDAWQAVGGYDERFGPGWCCEDGAFRLACETLLNTQRLPGVAYAIDHDAHRKRDRRNNSRYWWYRRAYGKPDEMRRLIHGHHR